MFKKEGHFLQCFWASKFWKGILLGGMAGINFLTGKNYKRIHVLKNPNPTPAVGSRLLPKAGNQKSLTERGCQSIYNIILEIYKIKNFA